MNIEKVDINSLIMNPNNPRTIKDDKFKKLVKSIKDFPEMLEVRPIVVDENMVVLGGNMRTKACISAGLKEVSIIKMSCKNEKVNKYYPYTVMLESKRTNEWDDYMYRFIKIFNEDGSIIYSGFIDFPDSKKDYIKEKINELNK